MGTPLLKIPCNRYLMVCLLSYISIGYGFSNPYRIMATDIRNLSGETLSNYHSVIDEPNVIWDYVTQININELLQSETIRIVLDNEEIELSQIYSHIDHSHQYRHFSSVDNLADFYLSIVGDFINGTLNAPSGHYVLQSISADDVVLLKYEDDTTEEDKDYIEASTEYEDDIEDTSESIAASTTTPIIRVLFLYTSAALTMNVKYNAVEQMRTIAYNYMNQGNESFMHSNINARFELAYIGHTNYNEQPYDWNTVLEHFYNKNDGYIDEVHTLRDKYAADICVLFINKKGLCGLAPVKAKENRAFCVVKPSQGDNSCNEKFTALHEIGHLIGCLHNFSEDNSSYPYKYGHGYVHYEANNPDASWRTMMSYDNECTITSCRRILYWSNPYVYYNGLATGTTNRENNARVWNKRARTVSEFRIIPENATLTATQYTESSIYENIRAQQAIVTNNGYHVESGQVVNLLAPTTIRLSPGTHIKQGAKFRAAIRAEGDPANHPQFVRASNDSNTSFVYSQENAISISPNPTTGLLNIQTDKAIQSVAVYQLDGQKVTEQTGNIVELYDVSAGIYILYICFTDGSVYIDKVIKAN